MSSTATLKVSIIAAGNKTQDLSGSEMKIWPMTFNAKRGTMMT